VPPLFLSILYLAVFSGCSNHINQGGKKDAVVSPPTPTPSPRLNDSQKAKLARNEIEKKRKLSNGTSSKISNSNIASNSGIFLYNTYYTYTGTMCGHVYYIYEYSSYMYSVITI
jgi:hypothetical protein